MNPSDKKNIEDFFRSLKAAVKPHGQVSFKDFLYHVSIYKKATLPNSDEILNYLEKHKLVQNAGGNIRFIKQNQNKKQKEPKPKKQESIPVYRCSVCNINFKDEKEEKKHNKETDHSKIEDERDRGGFVIEPKLKEPIVLKYSKSMKATLLIRFDIVDTTNKYTKLPDYKVYGMFHLLRFKGSILDDRLSLEISYQPKKLRVGYYAFLVEFIFDGFKICRYLDVDVENADSETLKPTKKYKPKKIERTTDEISFVPGVPPSTQAEEETTRLVLDRFALPSYINTEILQKEQLNPQNHSKYFSTLLFVEEKQMKIDIQQYDLNGTTMSHNRQYLELRVPGLAEKRPSVLVGDFVVAFFPQPKKEDSKKEASDNNNDNNKSSKVQHWQGFVHRVMQESVLLQFSPIFHQNYINNQLVNIKFTFSRLPLRRMHNALLNLKTPTQILFPSDNSSFVEQEHNIKPFNRDLNQEQLLAVHCITNLHSKVPYMIFGPPGTGKTVTVVEAILQLFKYKNSPILVCAPSNAAADIIVDRVCNVVQSAKDLIRINAYSRDPISIDSKIKKYCFQKDGNFGLPPLNDLLKARIVVTTCVNAGQLAMVPELQNHFSHIFIDEAGHATEPETLVCLSGLCTEQTSVILAGDPKQLGPVIRADLARRHGLEISLLERLYRNFKIYGSANGYNHNYITKLVRNYRSHESILRLPSELFYENQLVPYANQMLVEKYCKWEELPKKGFPIIFHGVIGKDEREGNSPSWFNSHEIATAETYLGKLLQSKIKTIQGNIGVIAPYRKQVEKFRQYFNQKNWKEIQVGSVEEFQGREKSVIIISTVRSSVKYIESDYSHNLGFLKNPKRFNVAITRAQALLVIIGNPFVLSTDPHWNRLLRYCLDNGAYKGYPITKEELESFQSDNNNNDNNIGSGGAIKPSDMRKTFGEVAVIKENINSRKGQVSQTTQQEDPEWSENR